MCRSIAFLCLVLFLTVPAVPVYAAATPSNADPSGQSGDGSLLETLPDGSPVEDSENLENVESEELPDGILDQILGYVKSLSEFFVPSESDSLSAADSVAEEESPDPVAGETVVFSDDPLVAAEASPDRFVNVLRYDIVVDRTSYVCLFPPEYIDSLYVDASNRLWNMSAQTVQGRIVDEYFDPYQRSGTLVYLTPCLGNNFRSIDEYGSPNYFRKYYYSGGRLTYDDRYVEIQVEKTYYPFVLSDLPILFLIFLAGGGVLICWLNRFRHY